MISGRSIFSRHPATGCLSRSVSKSYHIGARRISVALLLLGISLPPLAPAAAHDASAYGGVFRSRSMGASWLNADAGLFLSAALIVAIDPRNSNHLLMGTESGLLASVNGGRTWTQEAAGLVTGAVFAIAFSPDGATALCAAPSGIYRFGNGSWHHSGAPEAATPAHAIVFSQTPNRVWLLGRDQLFRSDDGGARFTRMPQDANETTGFDALAILHRSPETLLAVAHGRLLASTDGGQHWQPRSLSMPSTPVDTVSPDPDVPTRVWAAAADHLYVSTDSGVTWQPVGNPLPESHTVVRGIAADAPAVTLVVTTHRGTYRSTDAGAHWMLQEGNLPIHLEAGPLARDPTDPRILYAVYSLLPYPEVWRNALDGSNLLARVDPVSLVGGVAFLLLLILSSILLVNWLTRHRIPGAAR